MAAKFDSFSIGSEAVTVGYRSGSTGLLVKLLRWRFLIYFLAIKSKFYNGLRLLLAACNKAVSKG